MTDVTIQNEGSIFLFHLHSIKAKEWVDENVGTNTDDDDERVSYMGDALVVEHRYASDLADGMKSSGLTFGRN